MSADLVNVAGGDPHAVGLLTLHEQRPSPPIARAKLRAALTILGILIGVAAVVVVVALGTGVRQRVMVLLHKEDFSDLHACTFWLPAGQALSTYTMRTYATIAWSNATIAVYPSSVGSAPSYQWLRLDDVTLARTPGPVLGTECVEPGAGDQPIVHGSSGPGK